MTTPKTTPNDEQNHTIITSADELLRRYAAGERDFRVADLYRANLSGANLSGADLYRANLSGANLYRANLYRANLSGANLYRANLSGAYLSGANLYRANLSVADLYRANLSGANLSVANLSGAKNPPSSSHDFLAEILRQAANDDYEKRSVAGLVLVSRDWCWKEFGRASQAHWSPALRAWIAATLAPWPALVTLAQRYHVIEREAHEAHEPHASATDEKATDEEAQP